MIDALYIFGIEMPDAASELIFWHRRDLIDHESRWSIKTVAFVGRNRNAKQRRFGWIGGNDADRDGLGGIEAIILKNDCRPRLACITLAPATVHISPRFNQSPGCNDTASIKSWSRRACALVATTSD